VIKVIHYISDGVNIKIGYSHNPNKRLKQLQTSNHNRLTILATESGYIDEEKSRHCKFIKDRINQSHEWFRPSDELLSYINNISRYYIECQEGKI